MNRKKAIALVALGVIGLSVVAAIVVAPAAGIGFGEGGDVVFVIPLSGPIQDGGAESLFSGGGISPPFVRDRLREAAESSAVRAIVLRMNTGGGTVAASQEIADMVREFPKPVVVSMGDVTASGGYYVASQADSIVAQPGTLTGSIGVIWTLLDIQGLLDKVGVSMEVVATGKYKDMFEPGRLTPEKRQIIQAITDEAYGQFVSAVADGRNLPELKVRELATGQPYTGQQALALGLVDLLGGLSEAVEQAERLAVILAIVIFS